MRSHDRDLACFITTDRLKCLDCYLVQIGCWNSSETDPRRKLNLELSQPVDSTADTDSEFPFGKQVIKVVSILVRRLQGFIRFQMIIILWLNLTFDLLEFCTNIRINQSSMCCCLVSFHVLGVMAVMKTTVAYIKEWGLGHPHLVKKNSFLP